MINRIIQVSLQNRVPVIVIFCLLAVLGWRAMGLLPIDAIPDLGENQVIVYADWPGQNPQEVENHVTQPLTAHLKGLAGVETIRSTSMFGFAMVTIIFREDVDLYFARTRVLERLNAAPGILPGGIVPTLAPDATGLGQIFWYTLEGGSLPLEELRALQDWFVRYQINSVPGVAEVASIGGFVREFQVDLDPERLWSYGFSIQQISEAIQRSNRNVGAGVIESQGKEFTIRGVGLINGLQDLRQLVVGIRKGVSVTLADLSRVELGPAFRRGLLDRGGREVVGGVVVARQGTNTLDVIKAIEMRIQEIQPGLPSGVEIVPFYNRAELIMRAVDTLRVALIEEVLLVTVAHILFLWHFRSILIVTIPLPLAILISFLFMNYFGVSANIMSLGGIAIAIGVLVDAGIVMTENVIRQARQGDGGSSGIRDITLKASTLVARPLFFSMAIILLAFIPVFALTGREGKLFHPLALSKTCAMAASTVIALTLVPVLCTLLVRGRIHSEESNLLMAWLQRAYRPCLRWTLNNPAPTLVLAAAILAIALLLLPTLGSEFLPALDEGDILFMPITSPAVSLSQAQEIIQQQDRILATFPEVADVVGKVGRANTPTDPAPLQMNETLIKLKPVEQWRSGMTKTRLIADMDAALQMPGVANIWTQPIINRVDMLSTGIRTQLGVKVFGQDLGRIDSLAAEVEGVLGGVPGVVDLYADRTLGAPYLNIIPRRERALRYGVDVGQLLEVVETAIGGKEVSYVLNGRERISVRLRYSREWRDQIAALRRIPIITPSGERVRLEAVADIDTSLGPAAISSENGFRLVNVLFNVRGRDTGSVIEESKKRIEARLNLPPGYFLQWSGQYENQLHAEQRLRLVIPLVLAIIFVLLYLTYHSVPEAINLLLAIPFALSGGVFLLKWLGYPLSVAVWVGFIALLGTAVQTGIVMVIYLREALQRKMEKLGRSLSPAELQEAIMEGALLRLRPKLMTVFTVIASLLPLMWSLRAGSEVMKPIAAPVLGGMVSSLLHVLFVTPVIFYWIQSRKRIP
jgi:Cu(I)/Ag(I) efflux system membrane protein CusA/SilA